MKVLAIDPGIEKLGYALLSKKSITNRSIEYIASGIILTKRTDSQEIRLKNIYLNIISIIEKYNPDVVIVEKLFYNKNAKTVISVAQAQGAILCAVANKNLAVSFLTPLQIKLSITGYGRADKQAILKMIYLQLENVITVFDDDESDAIACGMAYLFSNKENSKI